MISATMPTPRWMPSCGIQPIADEGADQADNQVTDQAEAATRHHAAGQVAGDNSDDKDDEKALIGKIHSHFLAMTSIGNTR